jgi:hypothetical protein
MSLSSCYHVKLTKVKFPQVEDRKRKRKRSQEAPLPTTATPSQKRPRTSPLRPPEDATGENTVVDVVGKAIDPIEHWMSEGTWPKEPFKPESNMNRLLARKKSSSSRGRQSEAGSTTGSQKPRESKSTPYAHPSYETELAKRDSFMDTFDEGITKASGEFCQTLLCSEQTYPQDSLFRDDLFATTCRNIRNRNEAMVIRDISLLIVPSAQTRATYGATHLRHLIESVNEGWNCAIPVYGPRPQPDYSLGFGRAAFTDNQLEKLKPFVGEVTNTCTSHFMATWQMYFPFLTCEVKCGNAALDIADRQNAHSMTLVLRGYVELFKLVKREKELHREILAFSISHDDRTVRIYGHYPVIDGNKTKFYRHPIDEVSFAAKREVKWTAFRFTTNVHDIWMPIHFKRICSAIDELPSIEVSRQSEAGESGLSQGLESHHLFTGSSQDAISLPDEGDSQSSCSSRNVTPHTSVSQQIEGRASKKLRRRS